MLSTRGLLINLRYLITPEDTTPSLAEKIVCNDSDNSEECSGKIKTLFWSIAAILSGLIIAVIF